MRALRFGGKFVLVLLVCAGLSTVAQAQVTKTGSGYLFRAKYHKGMHIDYVMKVTSTPPGGGTGVNMSVPVSGVVTAMEGKVATVKITSGPASMNGRTMGQAQSFTVQIDDMGKMVGGKIQGMEGLTATLPSKPLKVGETFPFKQSVTMMGMPITVNGLYQLAGLKTVRGRQVAELKMTLTGSGNINMGFTTRHFLK